MKRALAVVALVATAGCAPATEEVTVTLPRQQQAERVSSGNGQATFTWPEGAETADLDVVFVGGPGGHWECHHVQLRRGAEVLATGPTELRHVLDGVTATTLLHTTVPRATVDALQARPAGVSLQVCEETFPLEAAFLARLRHR